MDLFSLSCPYIVLSGWYRNCCRLAAIELPNAPRGFNSMSASMLNCLNKLLTHFFRLCLYQPSQVYLAARLTRSRCRYGTDWAASYEIRGKWLILIRVRFFEGGHVTFVFRVFNEFETWCNKQLQTHSRAFLQSYIPFSYNTCTKRGFPLYINWLRFRETRSGASIYWDRWWNIQ